MFATSRMSFNRRREAFASFSGMPPTMTREAAAPSGPNGSAKFVAVVEMRTSVTFAQPILGNRLRARRPGAFPAGEAGGVELLERPADLERHAAQMQRLTHLEAGPDRTGIDVVDAVDDRDPFAHAPWVHDGVPDLLEGGVDVDAGDHERHGAENLAAARADDAGPPPSSGRQRLAGLPFAQRSLDRAVEAVKSHAEQSRGAIVARQQIAREALHERADEAGVLTCDRGGDGRGDRRHVAPERKRSAAHEHEVGDALDHLSVAEHVGTGDIE